MFNTALYVPKIFIDNWGKYEQDATSPADYKGRSCRALFLLHVTAPQCPLDLPAFVVITQDRAHNSKSRPYLNFIAICSMIISLKATHSLENMIRNKWHTQL